MTKKKTPSKEDIIEAAQKKLQEMVPDALKRLEELAKQTKNKTVAKQAKRDLEELKNKK